MPQQPLLKVVRTQIHKLVDQKSQQLHQQIDQYLDLMEKQIAQKQQARQKTPRVTPGTQPVTPKPEPNIVISEENTRPAPSTPNGDKELANFLAFMSKQETNERTHDVPTIS